jgi:hypothetical protein
MALVTKDFTFTAGNTIVASEHNSNFDKLFNLVNGQIDNANIVASAAIDNTKLASPNAHFMFALTSDGQYTAGLTSLRTFIMPYAATLVEVSACARDIKTTAGNEVYSVNVLEAGTTVLSSMINLVADDTPVVGSISDASLADNAKISVDLDMGGTSPTIDDITVFLTFKKAHTT